MSDLILSPAGFPPELNFFNSESEAEISMDGKRRRGVYRERRKRVGLAVI